MKNFKSTLHTHTYIHKKKVKLLYFCPVCKTCTEAKHDCYPKKQSIIQTVTGFADNLSDNWWELLKKWLKTHRKRKPIPETQFIFFKEIFFWVIHFVDKHFRHT